MAKTDKPPGMDGKNTFIVNGDWYSDFIAECTESEKAWLMDAMFTYNLTGEVLQSSNRFMNAELRTMIRWFDSNAEKWAKSKLVNSINQRIRWAKDSPEELKKLEDEKRYLQTHSVQAYTSVYGRIPSNTNEYERIHYVSVSDTVSDSVSVNDSVSDTVSDSEDWYPWEKDLTK